MESVNNEDIERGRNETLQGVEKLIIGEILPPKKWVKSNKVKDWQGFSSGTLQYLSQNGTFEFSIVVGMPYYSADSIIKTLEANKQNID